MSDSFGRERRSRSRSRERRRSPQRYPRNRDDDDRWSHDKYDSRGKGGKGDDRRERTDMRGPPPDRRPPARPDWICSQCSVQNFARRVQCFKCSSPKTDTCILLNGGGGPTPNRGIAELSSSTPTEVILVQDLGRETTELDVANVFRVYAPVKSVKIFMDPNPSGSRYPAAVIQFHSLESSSHVMKMSSNQGVKITGYDVDISFAKSTAPHIALAWAQAAAATKAREASISEGPSSSSYANENKMNDRDDYGRGERWGGEGGRNDESSGKRGGGHYGGHDDYDKRYNHRGSDRERGADPHRGSDRERGDRDHRRHRGRDDDHPSSRRVVAPKWPPTFEEDGAVWIFDPSSGYFIHRATEMFYEPKSKWYSKRDEAGVFGYYYHAPGYDPPFVLMPPATATTPATTTTTAATATPTPTTTTTPAMVSTSTLDENKEKKPIELKEKTNKTKGLHVGKTMKISMTSKTSQDINKWNDRKLETTDQSDSILSTNVNSSSSSSINPITIKNTNETLSSTTTTNTTTSSQSLNTSNVFDKDQNLIKLIDKDQNSLLMKLGLDYSTLGCLNIIPPSSSTTTESKAETAGQPLCHHTDDNKWVCFLSRRCFATEDQLMKHVRVSKLYKEELIKAINENRIIKIP